MRPTQVQFKSPTPLSVAANGNSGDIEVSAVKRLFLGVNLATLTGGAAPTVQFFVENKDEFGNYYPLFTGVALSAVGLQSASIGPGLSTNAMIARYVRVRWVVTGAPATATAQISLYGDIDG